MIRSIARTLAPYLLLLGAAMSVALALAAAWGAVWAMWLIVKL